MEKKGKGPESDIQFYHEKQSLQRCAVHAINNLMQKKIYAAKDLDAIANSFSNAWINPHKSVLGLGNYDANVLIKAVEDQGFEVKWFDKRKSTKDLDLNSIFGLIVNYKSTKFMGLWKSRHWISARRMNGRLYVFDSVRSKPISFNDSDAREFLQKMIDDADSELLLVHTANNSHIDIISNNNSEKNEEKQTSNSNL
jgi:josephin